MDHLKNLLTFDYFVIFLIIALGIMIGKIKIKSFYFDFSAVIFVALFFGHIFKVFDIPVTIPPVIGKIGLILFIYTIGVQAGPSFFDSFKSQGMKLMIVASITVVSGALVTYILCALFGIEMNLGVGLFTGALTSTPGLAAAKEAVGEISGIGYGIAYPFGVIGVILFVKLSPVLFRFNIKKEEALYKEESTSDTPELKAQNFIITNIGVDGKSIGELNIRFMTKANISRIFTKNKEMVVPSPEIILHIGDVLRAVGTQEALNRVEVLLGEKTTIEIPQSGEYDVRWYVVSNEIVVNKTIRELNLMENYNATIIRIRRSGIDLPPRPASKIKYGDKLLVSSSKGNVSALTEMFGDSIKHLSETSLLPVAIGIVLGILLGSISIPLFGIDLKLGLTGGILITSILLSHKGKIGNIVWSMSGPANQLLRQLGLLFFLVPIGLSAGQHLGETLTDQGFVLLFVGFLITLLPMIISVLVGHYMLKLNFLTLLGVLTGGMTSTPGLSAVDDMTDTGVPSIAYASVYPISLVWIIILSKVLGLLSFV